MLIHLSFPAKNPKHVASVLAELLQGTYKSFGPVDGGFMVFSNNEYSTGIEVYPDDTLLKPGIGEGEPCQLIASKQSPPEYSALHFAMAVNLDAQHIADIAKREGWRLTPHRRGGHFNVLEFWIENRVMVELIPPADQKEALAALKS